jgi:alpha-beta hydrolase superfamily lysophospholipase
MVGLMSTRFFKLLKWTIVVLAIAIASFLAARIYKVQSGPPLSVWHTYVPNEMHETELDASDWNEYLERERRIFEDVRTEVTQKLGPADRVASNRYFDQSPTYPGRFVQDFNRSFVLEPQGAPVGAAVLLHGLTDAPYSQRHIAEAYRRHGFVAIVIRLPGHGTVPAGLTEATWQDWAAATRVAVREARRRVGASAPLHIVGFSNGGALAMNYVLDVISEPEHSHVDRIVLISPMIGITRFAQFAGLAALPAKLPAFYKAAWLGILPEFNPFKYNSFPVNGAVQSFELTQVLQRKIAQRARAGQLTRLPPILTFQSVMDFTVSTPAIVNALYAHLPSNASELVLFDVNRTVKFGALLRPSADTALSRLLPSRARNYRTTVITNADVASGEEVERAVEPGEVTEHDRALGLAYPPGLYSLSHVALPFPMTDSLYGLTPDSADDFGLHLGTLAPRGERNVLIASLDALLRVSSNPFYPYMIERIEEGIAQPAPRIENSRLQDGATPAAAEPQVEEETSRSGLRNGIAQLIRLFQAEPQSDAP